MSEIVNLNKNRKQRQRNAKSKTAERNRILFGMNRQTRAVGQQDKKMLNEQLDGKRLEDEPK